MKFLLLNILGFKVVWWALIYFASLNKPWIGIAISCVWAIAHLIVSKFTRLDVLTGFLSVVVGFIVESSCQFFGGYKFLMASYAEQGMPLWLVMLWFCFGLLLNHSLSWIKSPVLAIISFGISGPICYKVVSIFGLISVSESLYPIIVIAGCWIAAGLIFSQNTRRVLALTKNRT